MSCDIDYTLTKKKGMKNLYIKIDKDCKIKVSCGYRISKSYIDEFVLSKRKWIESKQNNCLKNLEDTIIKDGSFIKYLGQKYLVKIIPTMSKRIVIEFKYQIFYITLPKNTPNDKILKKFDEFYKNTIADKLPEIIKHYSYRMQLYPTKITYRKTKAKWGSCNMKNELVFNTLLIKENIEFIEYVVVHELAHIIHKNHSKDFYELVEIYMPNYKEL